MTKDTEKDVPINPVYHKTGARNWEPHCIYFYYLTMDPDPTRFVRVYVISRARPIANIQQEVESIVDEIKRGIRTPCGWRLGDVKWRRRGYLVFIMDDATATLTPGNGVEFGYKGLGGNHTFFDGDDLTPFDNITGVYCLNHMQKAGGGVLGSADPEEIFEISPNHDPDRSPTHNDSDANHQSRGERSTYVPKIHNDSGTNTGPPIQP
ncbi:MAG: hypothetical protein QOH81_3143 [Sphingomonadales bacterium]|nr:hypothetical protein [Sphingomonadales bacterium]